MGTRELEPAGGEVAGITKGPGRQESQGLQGINNQGLTKEQASDGDVWSLKEHEATPEGLRSLALLLYTTAFEDPPNKVLNHLFKSRSELGDLGWRRPFSVSARLYTDSYAETYGLKNELLHRWFSAISVEAANAAVPVFRIAHEDNVRNGLSSPTRWDLALESALEVAQMGLRATLDDHCRVIRLAASKGIVMTTRRDLG